MILRKRKMIKKLIEKIFGKFCRCEEPIEIKKEEEPKIKPKIKCETHYPRYKKSCTVYRAAGKK